MTTTTTTDMYHHYELAVSAPKPFWRLLGYQTYSNTSEVGAGWHAADCLLAIAVGRGLSGPEALTWAAEEHQRRAEERTRSTAMAREADAVQALAVAIQGINEEQMIETILAKLTERTQYAVRQQLGRTS